MSDQVEMVAAKDAADNEAGAVETTPVQPEGQQPEAPVAAAAAEVSAAVEPVTEEVAEVAAAASTEDAPQAATAESAASAGGDESGDSSKRGNVRILAVGQQVLGTVKRIADFGAFVDIGVGRDGLIHISELSVRRVGKVTDVLSEGQEVGEAFAFRQ